MVQLDPGLVGRLEQGAQEFLEPPGAVEPAPRVGVPDGVERRGLSVRQVAGVLQYGVPGAAHALRGLLVAAAPCLVPQAPPDFVERVRHPADDVEAVQYAFGVRAPPADARVDPSDPVAGDYPDGGAARASPPTPSRPYHPVPFVVDDHGQVRVALPVAGLVHADRGEAVERRGHRRSEPFGDPMGDVSRGPPRDMQETADRLPVGDRHQPRALRLEILGEPAARFRPQHEGDHDAALGAVRSRHGDDQLDPPAAEVLAPPAAHAAAPVVPAAPPSAAGII